MAELIRLELLTQQLELLFRILAAGICGGVIGYERESRRKTAGIRTHVIVAVSSALMIVLSKYGFDDVLGAYVRLDPSRVAAGVVTAIGFLGSGIIFSRNHSVSGLTTSAGMWATVGVGMSIGAGMYLIGIVTSVIIILVEAFLGRRGRLKHLVQDIYQIEIECGDNGEFSGSLLEELRTQLLETYQCKILRFQVKRKEKQIRIELLVRTPRGDTLIHLTELAEKYPQITRISL